MTKDQKQPFEAEAETNRHRVQSLAPPKYALNPYAHYYAQKYREVVGTNPSGSHVCLPPSCLLTLPWQ